MSVTLSVSMSLSNGHMLYQSVWLAAILGYKCLSFPLILALHPKDYITANHSHS